MLLWVFSLAKTHNLNVEALAPTSATAFLKFSVTLVFLSTFKDQMASGGGPAQYLFSSNDDHFLASFVFISVLVFTTQFQRVRVHDSETKAWWQEH